MSCIADKLSYGITVVTVLPRIVCTFSGLCIQVSDVSQSGSKVPCCWKLKGLLRHKGRGLLQTYNFRC